MLLSLKTARFLLFLLLVAVSLSTAYFAQGGEYCDGEECSFVLPKRKSVGSKKYYYMEMDLMKESKYSRRSRMMMPKEDYRARDRFAAFTADYKGPRHHPPKNN